MRPIHFALCSLRFAPAGVAFGAGHDADSARPRGAPGRLDNGLTWYVRANRYPEHRAELRLVVNAGSVLEDDDQRGLAHFVEHMAFNGRRRFPSRR